MTLLVFRGCLDEPGVGNLPFKLSQDHTLPPMRHAPSGAPLRSCGRFNTKIARGEIDNSPVEFLRKGRIISWRGAALNESADVRMIAKPLSTMEMLIQELMQKSFLHPRPRMNCQNLDGKGTQALNCRNTEVGLLRGEANFDELLASDEVDESAH